MFEDYSIFDAGVRSFSGFFDRNSFYMVSSI